MYSAHYKPIERTEKLKLNSNSRKSRAEILNENKGVVKQSRGSNILPINDSALYSNADLKSKNPSINLNSSNYMTSNNKSALNTSTKVNRLLSNKISDENTENLSSIKKDNDNEAAFNDDPNCINAQNNSNCQNNQQEITELNNLNNKSSLEGKISSDNFLLFASDKDLIMNKWVCLINYMLCNAK